MMAKNKNDDTVLLIGSDADFRFGEVAGFSKLRMIVKNQGFQGFEREKGSDGFVLFLPDGRLIVLVYTKNKQNNDSYNRSKWKSWKATLFFLLERTLPQKIVAIVRDAEKLAEYAGSGIYVRTADYEDQESLEKAVTGVDRLLQISASATGVRALAQETRVVHAAAKCGVKEIVYTSTLFPYELAYFHAAHICWNTGGTDQAEQHALRIFPQQRMYHETIPLFIGEAMGDGRIFYPSGSGRVSLRVAEG